MHKKKYLNGLTTLTNNLEQNIARATQDFATNPNIILSEADLYTTNYNYSLLADESEKNNLFKYEFTIINNLKSAAKSYREICEKLYLAQDLLANYDNTQGMFYDWFSSMGLDKNFVYRCLDRYHIFLETNKDIYLSQEVSVRTIQLVKKVVDVALKIEIADKIQQKEFLSSKNVEKYLVSRVRQGTQKLKICHILNPRIKLTQTDQYIAIKLKGSFSASEISEIYTSLETLLVQQQQAKLALKD